MTIPPVRCKVTFVPSLVKRFMHKTTEFMFAGHWDNGTRDKTTSFGIILGMRWLSIVVILFASVGVDAQTHEKLRTELLAMRERDQTAREACDKGTTDERVSCYARVAERVDKPNTVRLKEIMNSGGFPDAKAVGKDGLEAFYLILQHSQDVEFKQQCLEHITKAFEAKQLAPMDYANFTDRLLVNLGKPQVYGSNFEFKDGKLVMSPAEDVKNLDARRRKIGLPPMAEYVQKLKEVFKMEVVDPFSTMDNWQGGN